jgi:hypothetical protein
MTRNRLSAAILPVLAMVAVTAYAGTQTIDFDDTELGQIKTVCGFVCFGTNCNASGTITSLDVGPPFFVRGIRTGSVSMEEDFCNNTPGVTTPATLPRQLDPGQALVFDVDLVATQLGTFDRILSINGSPEFDLTTNVESVSGCAQSPTANCLNNDRFKVRAHWRTTFGTRGAGPVVPGVSSDDSGLFYFFNQDNWEVLLKVLDACSMPQPRFWVFSAATTNVEYTITVVDTEAQPNQVARSYFKPQGPPAPAITDTNAFATCP